MEFYKYPMIIVYEYVLKTFFDMYFFPMIAYICCSYPNDYNFST